MAEVDTTASIYIVPKWINPVNGIITSSFGERINPVLEKQEFHNGIDIAVEVGTKVAAVQDGVVTEISTSETFGNIIKYKTESGYEIMYAHLQKALIEVGDKIIQGQIIALSGNSGLTTGAHLHYTVITEGNLIDPFLFVNMPYTIEVKAEYKDRGEKVPSQSKI